MVTCTHTTSMYILNFLLPKILCGGCAHSMIESLTICDQRPNHEVSLQLWMSALSVVYHLLGQISDHADTFLQPSDDFRKRGALHLPTIAVVVHAWLWV